MSNGFEWFLWIGVCLTALCYAPRLGVFGKKVRKECKDVGWLNGLASFFWPLLIVLALRGFVIDQYRIPSGSLKPTLKIGDIVLVNRYEHGLRLPVTHAQLTQGSPIRHGEIIVFRNPVEQDVIYIKRVIGVPGDHIHYEHKQLTINGELIPQKKIGEAKDNSGEEEWPVNVYEENLLGTKHQLYRDPEANSGDVVDVIVPAEHYFLMGDNRDNSSDSRMWGFISDKDVIGRAFMVWMSWDSHKHRIRFSRIGVKI